MLPTIVREFYDAAKDLDDPHAQFVIRTRLQRAGVYIGSVDLPEEIKRMPSPTFSAKIRNKALESLLKRIVRLAGCRGISYSFENEGIIGRAVSPLPGQKSKKASDGGNILDAHTEVPSLPQANGTFDPNNPVSPDIITLLCIRQDVHVPTNFILLDDVISQLDVETIRWLQEPLYFHKAPPSYNAAVLSEDPKPILVAKNGTFEIQFNSLTAEVWGPTSREGMGEFALMEAMAALEKLKSVVAKTPRHSVNLKPGEYVLLNNRRVIHERGIEIEHTPRGAQRFLARIYAVFGYGQPAMCIG